MPFNPNKFVNPGQFGDYSSYSGLGADDQMKSVKQVAAQALLAAATGGAGAGAGGAEALGAGADAMGAQAAGAVPPPQTFGEMATQQVNQAIAPIQQKFTNVSNAASQFGQGNFAQGVNAYRGYTSPQPSQPNIINQHYGVE